MNNSLPSVPQHLFSRSGDSPCTKRNNESNWNLAPVERRRKAARDQLKETSEIAAILSSGDDAPLVSSSAQEQGCEIPQNVADQEIIACAVDVVVSKIERKGGCRKKLTELIARCPGMTRLLLSNSAVQSGRNEPRRLEELITKKRNEKKDDERDVAANDETFSRAPLLVHLGAWIGNAEAFECLFDADAEATLFGNPQGHNALHLAVQRGHLEIVRTICSGAPVCCRYLDREGNLPLHLALGKSSQLHETAPLITSTLLANYPRGIMVPDRNGHLPIHLAAMNGFLPGMRGLLAVNSSAVSERLGDNGDDALPVDLAIEGHKQMLDRLHNNASGGCTTENMQVEIEREQVSDAATTTSPNGLLPSPADALASIENAHPQQPTNATWDHDKKALLNLKHQYEECVEVLLMSAMYKRAVFMPRDETHEDFANAPFFLPLHAGLCGRLKPENWDHLLTMYGGIHSGDVDRDGRTLLHAIADACNPEIVPDDHTYDSDKLCRMVKQIHARDPTSHTRKDNYGLIPLHLAVLNGASAALVSEFMNCGSETSLIRWTE